MTRFQIYPVRYGPASDREVREYVTRDLYRVIATGLSITEARGFVAALTAPLPSTSVDFETWLWDGPEALARRAARQTAARKGWETRRRNAELNAWLWNQSAARVEVAA